MYIKDDTAKKKNNIYQKISIYLQKKYKKNREIKYKNIKKTLLNSYNNLKQINSFYSNSQKELDKYKNNTSLIFIERDEIVNIFYLFAPIIGLIDKQIEEKNKNIYFNRNFLDFKNDAAIICAERITNNKKEIEKLSQDRNKILSTLCNYKYHYNKDNINIEKLLSIQPSYINFNTLYNEDNNYIVELITAYNLGYTCSENLYDDLFRLFETIINNLNNNTNKSLIKKI